MRWSYVALMAAWVTGVVLRLWHLEAQLLVDDEWHLVHKLRDNAALFSIVGDFGSNDHSIALGAYGWLLMRLCPLSELSLRLPSVAAGLLLLVLAPLLTARHIDVAAGVIFAWLLAVSPLLCFFSRLARPYAMTAFLVPMAVVAFVGWFASGGRDRRCRRAYMVAAVSAPIFHLVAAPAVFAPFAMAALPRRVLGSSARPSSHALASLFTTTIVSLAGLLAVPSIRSSEIMVARMAVDRTDVDTVAGALQLLIGTAGPWSGAPLAIASVVGGYVLWQRSPTFAVAVLIASAVQIGVVAASGAAAIHVPIVAARYVAAVLPLLLLLPATGIAAIGRIAAPRARLVSSLVATATILLLFFGGPLPWIYEAPNDFTNHASFQADYVRDRYFERFRPYEVPEFYTGVLAKRPPGSTTIVEAPWFFYFHDFAYLQRLHRQHVLIGFTSEGESLRVGEVRATDAGFHLHRAAHLASPADLRMRGVDFVVLHRNLFTELRWPTGVTDLPVPMGMWIERYRAWCGAPAFEDRRIVVFAIGSCESA